MAGQNSLSSQHLCQKLLVVNLTEGSLGTQDLDPQILRKYIGGGALAAKLLWDKTTASTQPLSEENQLLFMIGPITGTPIPSANRLIIAAISPLTNIWGQAQMGGTFAHTLGHTPYSGIIVYGKASKPVYLKIDGDTASIEEASQLWGLETYETHDRLKAELGKDTSVITIGPGGEKLIKYALVSGDGKAYRVAARSGMGAVMGSKLLKAVTVKGSGKPNVYDEKGLKESIVKYFPKTQFDLDVYLTRRKEISKYHANRRGCIKHYTEGQIEGFGEKSFEASKDTWPYYCTGCRSSCILSLMDGDHRHAVGQVLLPFGSNCMIDNMEALAEACEICNRQGLDGTSAGQVMSLCFELYDKGLITKNETGGIELTWGNEKAMLQMLEKVVNRDGFGYLMGEGDRALVQNLGGISAEYSTNVKGLEFALYDPRINNSVALQYATASRGADHLDGFVGIYRTFSKDFPQLYTPPYLDDEAAREAAGNPFAVHGKAKLVAWSQNFENLLDSLTICMFIATPQAWYREPVEPTPGILPEQFLDWLNRVTGWNMDLKEFLKIGERSFNLKRLFNVRRGISRKDDRLPPRFLTRKRGGDGPAADNLPNLGVMLNEYYACRGWSEEGIPTKAKLRELDLQDEAETLENTSKLRLI